MPSNNEKRDRIELSVVILSYNTKQITLDCLSSVVRSLSEELAKKAEIVVLDNNSTDGSQKAIENYAKQHTLIKLIRSKENLGFSKGNNKAVQITKGAYVLFLNSDAIIKDRAIDKLLDVMKKSDDVAVLGPKLLNSDGSQQPSCGPFYSLPVVFAALFLRGDYWGLTRFSPCQFQKVDWTSGACILMKRALFEKLSGFDENIFMYMDEIDLLYRAKKKGYITYVTPDVEIVHLASASSSKRTFPILQVYCGLLYFYKKHHSTLKLQILKGMLQLKAHIAYFIGTITQNNYLMKTYAEAQKMVDMA